MVPEKHTAAKTPDQLIITKQV